MRNPDSIYILWPRTSCLRRAHLSGLHHFVHFRRIPTLGFSLALSFSFNLSLWNTTMILSAAGVATISRRETCGRVTQINRVAKWIGRRYSGRRHASASVKTPWKSLQLLLRCIKGNRVNGQTRSAILLPPPRNCQNTRRKINRIYNRDLEGTAD